MPRYVVRYNRGWLLLCDVMVSIGDFGSSCRGSNPLTTTNHKCLSGEMVDTRDLNNSATEIFALIYKLNLLRIFLLKII